MSNTNKMLIDASHPEETRVVVLRNGRVEEFDYESAARKLLRGNIYLAKVTRVEPALQAAFVDYGGNRHGFLAFNEIHPDYYQIPIADRIALLEEEAAIEAEEEAEADARAERMAKRRGNGRPRRSGRGGRNDRSNGEQKASDDGSNDNTDANDLDDSNDREADDGIEDIETSSEFHEEHDENENTTEAAGSDQAPDDGVGDPQSTSTEAVSEPEPEHNEASTSADTETIANLESNTGTEADTDTEADDGTPPRTIPQSVGKDPTLSAAPETPDDVTIHNIAEPDDTAVETDGHEHDASDASDATPGDEAMPASEQTDDELAARTDADEDEAEADDDQETDADDLEARKTSDDEDEGDDDTDSDDDNDSDKPEDVDTEVDAFEEVAVRPRRTRRSYKIQEVIKRRQVILIQVVKEERGNKGAALTTYLSLAGRYTVLMPNTARGGGISRKITNPQDRKRLKSIANELEVPEGMGLIIRTAGAARTKQEIRRDFEYLLRLWESVRELTLESTAPSLVYEEGNLIKRSIRDLYNKDVEEVVVAGDHAYREAKDFMRMLMPSHAKNVVAFKDPEPLFTRYQIERQLNAMFLPQVTLKSGGYLVINQTEALVAVDVNSGRSTREFSIEETALHTNLEAAEELARQLKLRDLAGLIVVDFIDMEEKRNNRAVERKLKDALRHDRARIQVGRISHFGLLEMSRQRMRTGVLEGSTTQCSHCQGTGIIRSTESISLAVLRGLEDAVMTRQRGSLTATTSAAVALYILNNKRDFVVDMENRCGYAITIDASDKVVGANFSIERGPANVAPNRRVADKSAVNMDWGFETDDEEAASAPVEAEADDENVSARSNADEDANGRKRRRRRRRGGRRTSENAGEEFNGADDGDGEDENRDASASEATANDGESDDGETSDDDKPRSRRGRRRGRRGGRRNRERQASRDESGEETENAGQDTDGEEATAENSDGADIPGLGPQPSISASVIEITTPGANTEDEQRPEAGTDDAPAAVIADEVEVSAAPNADELETEPEAEAEAEKPKRRSRARSTTGRTATRRAKPKTDNDAEPAKALDTPEASTDADTNVDDQHAPAEPAPTEPAKVDHADSIAATAGDIADADDTSADRSKRTAPVMDKPRVERVTVGPPGSEKSDSNDTAPAAPTADDDTTDKPSRRGWWQRRILGD